MKILITGGSSDIGMAIARRRLQFGDEVIITSSKRESLEKSLSQLKDEGFLCTGFVLDLSCPESAAAEIDALCLADGIQGLVLNAAMRTPKLERFHELDSQFIQDSVHADIMGNVWLVRRFLPELMKSKFGRMVFISSGSAALGTSRYGTYCMVKAAIEGLFLNIAVDYGSYGICANIVRPGIIATDRNKQFWSRASYVQKTTAVIPLERLGTAKEVAVATDPLLSIDCYMTGSVISVMGGLPMLRGDGMARAQPDGITKTTEKLGIEQ